MISHHIHAALARERRNTLLARAETVRRARWARSASGGQAVLRDGSLVLIRQVRRADAPLLAEGFERLSSRSRWMRFMMAKPKLSAAELRYLTDIDHHDHEALGALDHADGRGVGIARYVRDADDPRAAEIAVTVIDDWHGRGLGTALLARLSHRARQEGIRRFTALTAADNLAIAGLLAKMGADVIHREAGTLRYELDLAPAGEDRRGAVRPALACPEPC